MTVDSPASFRQWAARLDRTPTFLGSEPGHGVGLLYLLPATSVMLTVASSVAEAVARSLPPTDRAAESGGSSGDAARAVDRADSAASAGDAARAVDRADSAASHARSEPRVVTVGANRRTTEDVLADPAALAALAGLRRAPALLVFKTSFALEKVVKAHGWTLLATPSHIGRRWENKLAFLEIAQRLGLPTPPSARVKPAETSYPAAAGSYGPDLVVQAPHGYSGMRTLRVRSESEWDAALERLRAPEVRVSRYMEGRPLTVNACVTGQGVAVSRPCVQLTGEPLLTPHTLGSCGNDWTAPLPDGADAVVRLAKTVGRGLSEAGYKGIFGLDAVVTSGTPLVIEVNPRLVASVSLFTQLELLAGRAPLLARHLLAHLDPQADAFGLDAHQGPVEGSQMILHNLEPGPISTDGNASTGIYAWDSTTATLDFVRQSPNLSDVGTGEVLILVAPEGRPVSPGSEIGRVQLTRGLADATGALSTEAQALATAAYRRIRGATDSAIDAS